MKPFPRVSPLLGSLLTVTLGLGLVAYGDFVSGMLGLIIILVALVNLPVAFIMKRAPAPRPTKARTGHPRISLRWLGYVGAAWLATMLIVLAFSALLAHSIG